MSSLFQELGCYQEDLVCLSVDALDSFLLGSCKDAVELATMHCLAVQDHGTIFQYGPRQGLKSFRVALAQFLQDQYQDKVSSDALLVTGGFIQGLTLLCNVLLQSGDPIFVEDPISPKALDIFKCLNLNVIPVPMDEDGLNVELLEKVLSEFSDKRETSATRPYWGAVYVTPAFHDPTGVCLSTDRCHQLASVAQTHGILCITNDMYHCLAYKEENPPFSPPPKRLATYDSSHGDDGKLGHIVSLGTLSTIFGPGLRLGWIEAPPSILNILVKSAFIKHTGAQQQYVAAIIESALDLGSLHGPLMSLRVTYHSRLDCLCKALQENLPKATFTKAKGGLFVWVTLPSNVDVQQLLTICKEKYKVDFEPGTQFSAGGSFTNYLRVSLSHYGEESLVKGVKRIAEALKEIT